MRARRELRLAVLLCLLGSAVVLFAVSRTWVTFAFPTGLTSADLQHSVRGSTVVPGARALGYVGLAGVLALAATRSWGRIVVGVLVAAAGIAASADVVVALHRGLANDLAFFSYGTGQPAVHQHRGWAVAALLGAVLLAAAGLLVAVRGRRWVALSSSYDAPSSDTAPAPTPTDKGVWDALDRGDDPTA